MEDHQSLLARAWALLSEGDAATARQLSARVFAERPENGNALFLNGLACLQCGDAAAAAAALVQIVRVAPQLPAAHKALADAYRLQGALGQAEEHYRLAIGLDRNGVENHLGLMATQVAAGRTLDAMQQTVEADRIAAGTRLRRLLADRLVRSASPVLFEIGAGVGHGLEKLEPLFPAASVHAFEPHPTLFGELSAKSWSFAGIVFNSCALSDACGRQPFYLSGDRGSSSLLPFDPDSLYIKGLGMHTEATIETEVLTLDSYCLDRGVGHIDFVSLVVQGCEAKVLAGAAGLLQRQAIDTIQIKIIFRNYYKRPASFFDVESILQPNGYRLISIFDMYPATGGNLFQLDAVYTRLHDVVRA